MGNTKKNIIHEKAIRVKGASENNLRGITVDFPRGRLVGVTGVSGSGKSSLVFDVLAAEGHRKYVESLSPKARDPVMRCTGMRSSLTCGAVISFLLKPYDG